jgi:hypothetical protein
MTDKDFREFQENIRKEIRESMIDMRKEVSSNMAEMRQENKNSIFVQKIITTILGTLFIAFVGIGIKNMIEVNNIKRDNDALRLPLQMVVIKINEMKAMVVDKDMNAYNKYKEQENQLEIKMLAPEREPTRGGK